MRQQKIKGDIERIKTVLESSEQPKIEELYEELIQTYSPEIKDLGESMLDVVELSAFFHNLKVNSYEQIPEKKHPENYKKNLRIIQGRLELLVEEKSQSSDESKKISINIHNDNKNLASNQVSMSINITFDNVRQQIRSMDENLDEDQITEILNKIDELEKIIESNDKKPTKWKKIGSIGKWIFDKSVDVGITLLPLLLKVNQ